MGLNPGGVPVQTAIAVWTWGAYLGGKEAVDVKISEFIRPHPKSTVSNAKICGLYVNSILASLEAKRNGFDEALLLDFEGNVAEGPGENIFIVKDKKLFTPAEDSILPGITRDSVIEIAEDMGIPVGEKKMSPSELKIADEVFFTGTAVEVCPIGKIDDILINQGKPGEITKKIKETYGRIVRGEEEKYASWLSFIQ